MRKSLVFIVLLVIAISVTAQEITIQTSPSAFRIMPGEPIGFLLSVKNCSGHDLQIIKYADYPPFGFRLNMRLLSPDKNNLACCGGSGPLIVKGNTPPSEWPKTIMKDGQVVTQESGLYAGHSCCPLSDFPAGDYTGIVEVEADAYEPGNDIKTIKASIRIPIQIIEPRGQDLAFIHAIQQVIRDKETNQNQGVQEKPLRWQDLVIIPRLSSQQIALSSFSASTYTGYVLAKKIPDYSNPLFHPVCPAEQVKACRDEGKTCVTFPDSAFESYFQQLAAFMKGGHVPDQLAATMWDFYGEQLLRRGKIVEAEDAFQHAVKAGEPSDQRGRVYYERAKEHLEALAKK